MPDQVQEQWMTDMSLRPSLYEAVGEIVKLMSCSEIYRNYTVRHIEQLVVPAIITEQCSLYYDSEDGDLVAFVSHTMLDTDAEHKFLARKGLLDYEDWLNDPIDSRLWLMDFIAPFGGVHEIASDVKQKLRKKYPGRRLFFRRQAQDDRVNSVMLKPDVSIPLGSSIH